MGRARAWIRSRRADAAGLACGGGRGGALPMPGRGAPAPARGAFPIPPHMTAALRVLALPALALAAACAEPDGVDRASFSPDYRGVETRLLEGDLVNFRVAMSGARDAKDVTRYAECAAAQYALIRGYGFARHVRTNVEESGGLWQADAVYTISAGLPQGLSTIDAEVTVANCTETGIPTV